MKYLLCFYLRSNVETRGAMSLQVHSSYFVFVCVLRTNDKTGGGGGILGFIQSRTIYDLWNIKKKKQIYKLN